MRNALNLVYLAVYVGVTLIQYAHPLTVNQFPFVYLWAIGALSYPLFVGLTHSHSGFWKGLLTILLISVAAQAVEAAVYLIRTKEYLYRDTDTVVLLGVYLMVPVAVATTCYPVGYLLSWLWFRRKIGSAGRNPSL